MSQSPIKETKTPGKEYLNAWQDLATRIRNGNSFSGREPNSCFLNTREGRFADVSMISGFGLTDDARSLASVDWDDDGDLDLWVTNRTAPRVRLLRNDYDAGTHALTLQLEGDPAQRANRDAIGAVVEVTRADDLKLTKAVVAGNGFLSQSTKRLNFGLGVNPVIKQVRVRWPGQKSFQNLVGIRRAGVYQISQSGLAVKEVKRSQAIKVAKASKPETPPPTSQAHVSLTEAAAAPRLHYRSWKGDTILVDPSPVTLVVLWASWCQPCLQEMASLVQEADQLQRAGIHIIALNVETEAKDVRSLERVLTKLKWPFASGLVSVESLKALDLAQRQFLYKQEPLPLPSSFLFKEGMLMSFAKGPVSLKRMLTDAARPLGEASDHLHAVPFSGSRSSQLFVTHPVAVASAYLQGGYTEDARVYLKESLAKLETKDAQKRRFQVADIQHMIGESYRLENAAPTLALPHYAKAVAMNPDHAKASVSYARALSAARQGAKAVPVLESFLKRHPNRIDVRGQLGNVLQEQGKDRAALAAYQVVLKTKPNDLQALNQMCWIYATSPEASLRAPKKALPLAQRLMKSGKRSVYLLDTAAAALASAGDFAKAVQLASSALAQAKARRDARLVKEIEQRLALYKKGKPFVRTKP